MFFIYSKRKELAKLYEKWIKENNIKDCAESVIAFLYGNNLMNVENAMSFIEKGGENNA